MAVDLDITMRLSKQLAEAASTEFFANQRKREKQAVNDAEIAEKAKTAIFNREVKQRVQEIVRQHKTDIDLANEAAKAKERAAKEGAAAKQRADKEEAKSASDLNRLLRQLDREANRQKLAEDRATKQEEMRLERELAARYRQNVRDKREEQKLAALEAKAAMKDQETMWGGQEAAIKNAATAVGAFALGMVGLNSVAAVVGEIDGAFQRARDSIFSAGNLLQDYRENLLELAALKDRMGDTSSEVVESFRIQAQTGQKTEDVRQMQLAALGVGESAIGKNISREEFQKSLMGIGSIQAVEGGDAGAYGRLAGFLAQTTKGKDGGMATAGDITSEAGALYSIARPGGFEWSSALNQYGKSMPFIKSGLLSERETMGLLSAFSISEPDEAATRLDQFMRATVGATGRDRRVKGVEGSDNIGTATYLKGLGIDQSMGAIDIGQRISADIAAAQAKGGENFNPYAYLQSKGYGNQSDLKALLNFSGFTEDQTWAKTFAPMIGDPNLGAGTLAQAEAAKATDVALQGRQARGAEEIAKMLPGMGKNEWMTNLRRMAYAGLKAKDASLPEFGDIETASPMSPREMLYGYKKQVDRATQEMIMAQADAAGLSYQSSYEAESPTGILDFGSISRERYRRSMSQDEQYRVSRDLAGRGVDLGGGTTKQLAEAAANLNQAAGFIKSTFGTPPALDGRPEQPSARP